jgi:Na+-driven multidrug efflux pump
LPVSSSIIKSKQNFKATSSDNLTTRHPCKRLAVWVIALVFIGKVGSAVPCFLNRVIQGVRGQKSSCNMGVSSIFIVMSCSVVISQKTSHLKLDVLDG